MIHTPTNLYSFLFLFFSKLIRCTVDLCEIRKGFAFGVLSDYKWAGINVGRKSLSLLIRFAVNIIVTLFYMYCVFHQGAPSFYLSRAVVFMEGGRGGG